MDNETVKRFLGVTVKIVLRPNHFVIYGEITEYDYDGFFFRTKRTESYISYDMVFEITPTDLEGW
jgi:hypothetical protein